MIEKNSKLSDKIISKKAIIIAAIIIIGGSYYWYKKTHPANTEVQYVTTAVEKGTLSTSISGSGNIIVDQQANIDPTINGTVANLAVTVGDPVTEGQFLFSIINNDLGVSVAKAAASYEQSLNSLESAKIDKDSAKATYEKSQQADDKDGQAYTTRELEVLKDKVDLAKAKVDQAEKSLSATLLDYKNIQSDAAKRKATAPIGGTVNSVNIKNGDDLSKLSSGSSRQVPIIIGNLESLKAQVQINEVDVPNVQIGQKTVMTFNSMSELTASGQVEKIDSLGTITQGVVIYNATIGFDTLDQRIKPGMSVSASIITGIKQDVIIVPNGAVKAQGADNYVEVLNSSGEPQKVTVEIGAANNTDTEIVSGLKVGDEVVTRTINPNTPSATSTQGQGGGIGGGGAFRALH